MKFFRLFIPPTVACLAMLALGACSQDGADSLAGPDLAPRDAEQSGTQAVEDAAASPQLDASTSRLEARLNPVIAVDASGQARLDFGPGTANDRFTSEVEIAKNDFNRLDIDASDGFNDEVVQLRVLREGTEIFSRRLQFSENRPADITFETDVRGAPAPELQAGDVARVIVNRHSTLRGTLRVD